MSFEYEVATQITITKAPSTVYVGQEFEVSGYLMAAPPPGRAEPVYLEGMPVILYVDGVATDLTYTGEIGRYSFRLRLDYPKVYTIKVVFPGYPPEGGGDRIGPGPYYRGGMGER